jgi:hypothetical protein
LITRPSDFRDTQRHGLDSSRTRGAPISKNYLIISVLAIKSKVSSSYSLFVISYSLIVNWRLIELGKVSANDF